MLAVLAITLVPAARAVAEDITFASHAEIMSVLERQNARIAELEQAVHNGGGGCSSCGGGGDSCCDSCSGCSGCCGGCCDPCCRPAGFIGSAELLFLKAHQSMGIRGANNTDLQFNYDPSYRLTAGYQGSDGLGVRLRYWEFNHTASAPDQTAPATQTDSVNYDTYAIDLEFIDSMSLGCYWDATFFAGFRYVEWDEERVSRVNATGLIQNGDNFDNAAYGLTTGGELRRCIGNGLALYVNNRVSVLFGDASEFTANTGTGGLWVPTPNYTAGTVNDCLYYIYEAQAGAQWTNELQAGGYLYVRSGVEVQYWNNFTGEPFFDHGEAWGLGGFTFSAGVIR